MMNFLKSISQSRIALAVILSFIALYAFTVSFRSFPGIGIIGYDREVFRYMGMLINQGALPYREGFDHKPPLIYFLTAFSHPFGNSFYWLMETTFLSLAALSVFFVARKRKWPMHIIYPFYLIALLRIPHFFNHGGLTRSFSSYFITFALTSIFYPSRYRWHLIGFFAVFTFFLQQNDAPALILPFIWLILWENHKINFESLKKILPQVMIGGALVLVPLISWFLYKGIIRDLIQDAFLFNTGTYAFGISKWEILKLTKETLGMHYFKTWILLCVGIMILVPQIISIKNFPLKDLLKSPVTFLWMGFLLQTFLLNITGVKFDHYFLSLMPWMIFITGESLKSLKDSWAEKIPNRFFVFLTLIVCFSLPNVPLGRSFDGGLKTFLPYRFSSPTDPLEPKLRSTLETIRGQKGQFYVFGHTPLLYANIEYNIIAPTRWAFVTFWQQIPETKWDPDQAKFREILSGIENYKTKYILDFSSPTILPYPTAEKIWKEMLEKNYVYLTDTHGGRLYERK
jgi:hypothetical protein